METVLVSILNLEAFQAARLTRNPFDFLVLRDFVRPETLPAINRDYPQISQGGSFPVEVLDFGPGFAELLAELNGPLLRAAFAEKFGIDLEGRPTMVTVRGRCTARDGQIHTDSKTKIITGLIYLNSEWQEPGGQLRLLRSADDLNDIIVEVPPESGTLVAFRRSENSFHGHTPFVGERRVLQFNWMTSALVRRRELSRHRFSALMKRLVPILPVR